MSDLGTKTRDTLDLKSNVQFSPYMKDKVIFYFEYP